MPLGRTLDATRMAALTQQPATAVQHPAPFVWQDFSRFVEVHPVATGWLVLWGHHEQAGARKVLHGNRTYPTLAGARQRVADAAHQLVRRPDAVADVLVRFDRFPFPDHRPADLPDPL